MDSMFIVSGQGLTPDWPRPTSDILEASTSPILQCNTIKMLIKVKIAVYEE